MNNGDNDRRKNLKEGVRKEGEVMRGKDDYARRMAMEVQGRRKGGRPRKRWLDRVRDDIKKEGTAGGGRRRRRIMEAYIVIMYIDHT